MNGLVYTRGILRFLPLMAASLAWAQAPAAAADDDHQLIQQLLGRVKDLEAELKRLRGAPETAPAPPAPPVAATVPVVGGSRLRSRSS